MHIPMYDEAVQGYLADRRREVEMARFPKGTKDNGSTTLKLAVAMSGIALIGLVIVQMFVL